VRSRLLLLALLLPLATTLPSQSAEELEVRRVQRHLAGALEMLTVRDVSGLSAEQRAKRAWAIAELTRYRAAGEFPLNQDFAGEFVPYFVDQQTGVVCAVGHLMAQSGHEALVERIATSDNHVTIIELAADAEVGAWLQQYGLTLSEAARIQPSYEPPPPAVLPVPRTSWETVGVSTAAVLAFTGVLTNAFVAPESESSGASRFGIAVGAIGIGAGIAGSRYPELRPIAATSIAVGAGSLYFGSRNASRLHSRVAIAPIIGFGERPSAGMGVSLSF
jgi:hypothetical protein